MGAKCLKRKIEGYDEANLDAAKIIIAYPERYQGIMQEWAASTVAAFQIGNPSRGGLSEAAKLEAAKIIIADPALFPDIMRDWAASTIATFHARDPSREDLSKAINLKAAEIIVADPERYPDIMRDWAASTIAFHIRNPCEGFSEEDRTELSDLMAWRRR
jgi:hypothetical protein